MDRWISVKVHPNAGKDVLVSLGPDRFEAWVKAKPVDGQANEALIRLLERHLQVAEGHVRLTKGAGARRKIFKLIG